MRCVIKGCKSNSERKENSLEEVTFHGFPKNEDIKKQWVTIISRRNWTVKSHSKVCSRHFTPDAYLPNEKIKWRRLKDGALPTLNLTLEKVHDMDVCETEKQLPSFPFAETQAHFRKISAHGNNKILEEVHMDVSRTEEQIKVPSFPSATTWTHFDESSEAKENDVTSEEVHMDICVTEQVKVSSFLSTATQPDLRELHAQGTSRDPLMQLNTTTLRCNKIKASNISSAISPGGCRCSADDDCLLKVAEYYKKISEQQQRKIENLKVVSKQRFKKINAIKRQLSRLEKKNVNLYNILLDRLREEGIEKEYVTMLENIDKNDFIKRFLQKEAGLELTREYSLETKKFAVTLNYLSPKAYLFIREKFKDVLPHPKTISAWYKGVNCSPGFTSESFDAIRLRAVENPALFCALAIDEMAIRKLVEWDSHNQNYFGFVNVGVDLDSDSVPIATQALTFMVTCLNDTWKIPVGYFLIKSITSQQKSALVEKCIQLVQECNVNVISLTYDGAASNIAMCNELGVASGSVSFQCNDQEIFLWPDPCHNIKLVRNTLADKKKFIDCQNNIISWEYIQNLVELQENEGLHLGNKLKRDHVNFIKQKMKVRLATQLLSNSVADALQYCKSREIPGFENCDATITFIRLFNNLFDVLNSRNMRAKGWKKALTTFNFEETQVFFEAAETYIKGLKLLDGSYLISSNRKTGFNGFLVCMKSLLQMYEKTVAINKLQYLCTYKMSQDHLELFFGAIRSKCGFNNNPSARAFQAAYKRLLVHAQFKDGTSGNCIPLDKISILNYQPSKNPIDAINQSNGNSILVNEDDTELVTLPYDVELVDHDYILSSTSLSEYSKDVVYYMAGYVVRKLKRALKCETCIEALCDNIDSSDKVTLISIKDRGGLIKPSKGVYKVCEAAEKYVRELKCKVGLQLGKQQHVTSTTNKICQTFINTQIFDGLIDHSLEFSFENNHIILLIKSICQVYLTARIHHFIKQSCVPTDKIRTFLTKTILFKGQ